MSWSGMKKLNMTQQKHAYTNQRKWTAKQNKQTKKTIKPGLVAFYDIRHWKRSGSILKGKDKYGRR